MAIKINKNAIGNIETSLDKTNPSIQAEGDIVNKASLYFEDYLDAAKLKRFIKKVEKAIRSSDAYSNYIGNLRNEKGFVNCAVRGNITSEDASIEFHHYPFTLYNICNAVIMKHLINNEKFNSFSIANEVLELHSKNLVGLVPLCITEHQLVHDGVQSIPLKSVYGKVNEFVELYKDYLDDDIIEKYNKLIEILG